ncbi:16S rRNA (cytidine(1402)-2'-O)-methyltransferase [Marinomonas sp. IMCC 4694]|uniref:16S rRNA (cytidine(1402)-2'-O)-methyltransferase n=1 Tax=Marinomonas sp. IMCC 4694 TaxID=2605432 RepID=UPI0011E7BF0D|nr:16S rRNA (cytidine(1402)-2'-O)-methyltransferase [Marinomonas sp. IMCC 4694]TYL48046.1 16S rRNA (cytidine(1402)-2'-O)-methyltransferase [Marinomonas sp. IMCC 4694]
MTNKRGNMVPHSSDDVRGALYIVATPIGNLSDFSKRAEQTLRDVDYIAAEDTRHTRRLLNHFGIEATLFSIHDHNEKDKADYVASLLDEGKNVALVSDAGTPLISDPGYHVVNALRTKGHKVMPIPGACAVIAALCASGLPTDQFFFAGFVPAKSKGRCDLFESWKKQAGTVVFYESTHRVYDSIADVQKVYGDDAQLVLAREVTKTFETFLSGTAQEILRMFDEDANQMRGEFVVMLSFTEESGDEADIEAKRILSILLEDLPVKQAAAMAAKLTGEKKNSLYKMALEMQAG